MVVVVEVGSCEVVVVVVGCGDVGWNTVTCQSQMPLGKVDAEKYMLINYLLFAYTNGCLAQLVSVQYIYLSRSWVQSLL